MQWSEKQAQALDLCDRSPRWVFCVGAIRSGKSLSAASGFLRWAMKFEPNSTAVSVGGAYSVSARTMAAEQAITSAGRSGLDFLISAKTIKQVHSIARANIQTAAKWMGIRTQYFRSDNLLLVGRHRFHLHEGQDEQSAEKLQGLTFAGAYLDEGVNMPQEFIEEVNSRCSLPGGKIVVTLNPGSPHHWMKLDYIDRLEEISGEHLQFQMSDNPSLDPVTIDSMSASTTGAFYRRRILGQWSAATGQIFTAYAIQQPPPTEESIPVCYYLSVDYAASSVTHANLFAVYGTPPHQKHWLIDEWRRDGKRSSPMTDVDQATQIIGWIRSKDISLRGIVVDPTAPGMRQALKQTGYSCPIQPAYSDVHEGIILTAAWLASGKVVISPECKDTIAELGTYVWDEKAAEVGEDKPVKQFDHSMDALRYYVESASRIRPRRRTYKTKVVH